MNRKIKGKARPIMVQGTMSNAGKSLLVTGLCRVFSKDGYKVVPFKSQNMALNSWITDEGLEMGRAQVVQAEACGIAPSVLMNPILLKPTTDMGSQVIVMGEVLGTLKAAEYFMQKNNLLSQVLSAYETLAGDNDIIVIEGAGSPAEINLDDEFVNMGLAKKVRAPVLLAGDIDRGGVFAQLCGTLMLLDPEERDLVKALVINKFRGDPKILLPGLGMLEEKSGKPVAGVLPWLQVDIEDEDSLTDRFGAKKRDSLLDVAVIRLPKISNFTDFFALEATDGVGVRYVGDLRSLGKPDLLILPGTKNTISDLKWLRESGLEGALLRLAETGTMIFGICGGYQMLGEKVTDGEGVEIEGGGSMAGLSLLPQRTVFMREKQRKQVKGIVTAFGGCAVEGYEIHMGSTFNADGTEERSLLTQRGNVYGTYLHGIFDSAECRSALFAALCEKKGIASLSDHVFDLHQYKEEQFDILEDAVRENLDMPFIYRILEEGA
ncbi:cobyric acid synthase CobQ [Treponema primitia ZAS-2]|uniref:Cobyric acid synthase n=1 Tax=Treponema primitia (strain ATCC BAA-887 / DSM 12427 / ZAS-2) TaxID=545694 RepID=F5YLB3_TREPZ|nr:cobyric acid synthase [Treponema primitia]AEF86800.1 cobyric acid synthase CobQ [Treponema primitia ZAS-2]